MTCKEIPEIPESTLLAQPITSIPQMSSEYGISVLVPKISFHRGTSKSADIMKC